MLILQMYSVVSARVEGAVSVDMIIITGYNPVSYTHLRAHETDSYLVCRLLLEKKKETTRLGMISDAVDYNKIKMGLFSNTREILMGQLGSIFNK